MVIDFKGSIDGEPFEGGAAEDFPLVLGSGGFIPGFEDQLVGAKAGEETEVKVTFPESYGAKHLAGKEAAFAVTVKAVKAPKPAAIDDALATRYGAETLDALKGQIRTRLGDEYAQASRQILKRRLMDALDERVSFDLPPTLVDVEARQIAHQLWHEEHHDHHGHDHGDIAPTEEHRKLAERRVRLGLLLAEVGTKNEITVADQEVQRALFAQARQYPGPGAAVPRVRAEEPAGPAADPARRSSRRRSSTTSSELAQVTEKPVSKDELQKAIEALDEEGAALAHAHRGRRARPRGSSSDSEEPPRRRDGAARHARIAREAAAPARPGRSLDLGQIGAMGERREVEHGRSLPVRDCDARHPWRARCKQRVTRRRSAPAGGAPCGGRPG